MNNHWIVRVIGALLLLVGLVAVAYLAYNAGWSQGAGAAVPVAESSAQLHGIDGWHPLGFLFLAPWLVCLVPFFLCLFIFMPLRMLLGPHRMHPMHMHRRWHCGEGDIPTPFEEWHRRAHEEKAPEK